MNTFTKWFFRAVLILVCIWVVYGIHLMILGSKTGQNPSVPLVRVSQDMPVGTVVTQPISLGDGLLWLIQIQVEVGSKTPTRYVAITSRPELFPVGSPATLKNVTACGTNTSYDRFHIAVPEGSETQ